MPSRRIPDRATLEREVATWEAERNGAGGQVDWHWIAPRPGSEVRPLAYRVMQEVGTGRFVIRDPFGAAIDGIPSLERAIEIATVLAASVRAWAGEGFDR